MELRFKNGTAGKLFMAIFCSICVIFLVVVGIMLSFFTGAEKDIKMIPNVLLIFFFILTFIWMVFFFSAFVFCKTVIITEEEIILKRKKRIILQLNKNDIEKCVYGRMFANKTIYFNAGKLFVRMKNHVRIDREIGVSYKNVKKLMEMGYYIEIKN